MEDVDISHAKEHLEELLARAARGEDVRIVDPKYGSIRLTVAATRPDAPPHSQPREHIAGRLKGHLVVPARLLEPMSEDELAEWYGAPQ